MVMFACVNMLMSTVMRPCAAVNTRDEYATGMIFTSTQHLYVDVGTAALVGCCEH